MIDLLSTLIIPITILFIVPFVFGLWYINKEITARKLNTRTSWMVCLFLTPLLTLAIFYFVEVRRRTITPKI